MNALPTNSDSLCPPFCRGGAVKVLRSLFSFQIQGDLSKEMFFQSMPVSPTWCFSKSRPSNCMREQGRCCDSELDILLSLSKSHLASLVAAIIYSGLALCQVWLMVSEFSFTQGPGLVVRIGLTLNKAILTTCISWRIFYIYITL